MANWIFILIGAVPLIIFLTAMIKTRAVLRFRSVGTIEPGSISDWEVMVWRVLTGMMVIMTIIFIYITVFKL